MYSVELYNRVRRACHVDGMNKSAAGRLFGIDRKTVAKILKHSVPPGYRRAARPVRPKLDPFIPVIDQILEDDKRVIKKQRHTAKRIHARLRAEHGFTGGITIVTDYVREKQRRTREVFVPLSHAPGHVQVDFGETLGVIGGVECKLHYFAMSLPHSDAFFMKAQPDYDVLAAIAAYFVGFPDRCHHPKEDLIYRKMRVRNPELAQTVPDLEAEHEEIAPLAHKFWEAVQSVLQGAEISRNTFDEVARHFVRVQRRHMEMEEEHFLPLAQQILTRHDWAEIDERITREEDPVFGGKVPQVFAALRDDILKWEAEDEAQEV